MAKATAKKTAASNGDVEKKSALRSPAGSVSPKEKTAGTASRKRGGSPPHSKPVARATTKRGRKATEEESQENGSSMEIDSAPAAPASQEANGGADPGHAKKTRKVKPGEYFNS